MTKRRPSPRATAARRYHGALKAIRAKHPTATHRDAQFVYRILKAKTGGAVITGRQIAAARRGTTARALTDARNRGSRSRTLTPADAGKLTKERKRGKAKTPGARGSRGSEGGGAAEGPAFVGGGGSTGGGGAADEDDEDEGAEEDIDNPDTWDDYEGEFEDFEYETSADYGDED